MNIYKVTVRSDIVDVYNWNCLAGILLNSEHIDGWTPFHRYPALTWKVRRPEFVLHLGIAKVLVKCYLVACICVLWRNTNCEDRYVRFDDNVKYF